MNDDYDSPWKDALTRYFPEFMSFYFPEAHRQIDWAVPVVFLEQELAQVVRDGEMGCRRVDKLVRVVLRKGTEEWVLVHVDVQGQYDKTFAERIFIYNYRIYDRYRRPVASFAVLADCRLKWRPDSFKYSLFGCEMGIQFPAVKLRDYFARLDRLLSDDNAFALVTAAHLLTQQTRRQHVKRSAAKWRLARLLYERNWNKQRVIDLFGVIDWMMQIPPEMQMQLMSNIEEFEGKLNTPNMNSFDRRNEFECARQEGREEGRHDLWKFLAALLEKRFGRLPQHVRARLEQADKHELRRWGESMLDATSLDRVFSDR